MSDQSEFLSNVKNIKDIQILNKLLKEASKARTALLQEKAKADELAEKPEEMDVDQADRKRKEPENAETPDFKLPRKTSKKSQETETPVVVKNQFDILSKLNETPEEEHLDDDSDQEDESEIEKSEKTNTTPIILRSKEEWTCLSKLLKLERINYTKAVATKSGIRIHPQTVADYKNMYKYMKEKNFKFFTHQLKSEKTLKIVIKGIPVETKEKEVGDDLKEQGYPTQKITRMKSKGGKPAAMILIELDRKYKSFYNINRVNGLVVKVESLKSKGIPQCHRCQMFGHIQANCNSDFRCMKCAGFHSTHVCEKEKTTPAKCANCDGEHTSVSKLCKMRPKPGQQAESSSSQTVPQERKNPWNRNVEKPKETPKEPTKAPEKAEEPKTQHSKKAEIANELSQMLIEFSEKNPTEEEENTFTKHITKILRLLNGQNKN